MRLLLPRATAGRLSRRRFLGLAAGGAAALAAGCTSQSPQSADEPPEDLTAILGPEEQALGGGLSIFSWEEYSSPENLDEFSARFDVEVSYEIYESNEEAIAGMRDPGTYDIVVPANSYIPSMVADGLLLPLDKDLLGNLGNVTPDFVGRPWDPDNAYTVMKSWGTAGYLYDTTVVPEVYSTWEDFFTVAALPEVSGRVAVLADRSPVDMALWSLGFAYDTDDLGQLDQAEALLTDGLLPHLTALDSYPVDGMLDETYALAQFFNGDARTVVLEFPERYRWVLPTPHTDLWVDHWAIPANAPNPEAAHAFIDFMLQPNIAARELAHHGYGTGILGMEEYLPFDLQARDMIFFSDEEMARTLTYEEPATEQRRNEIVAALEDGLAGP